MMEHALLNDECESMWGLVRLTGWGSMSWGAGQSLEDRGSQETSLSGTHPSLQASLGLSYLTGVLKEIQSTLEGNRG